MHTASTLLDGRYLLEERLGAGGAAEVWAAHDRDTGERVAIKTLHARCHGDEALRLHREASILEHLTHPAIARLRRAGVVDQQPYLVLDLIEGDTLAQLLVDGGLLPAQTVGALAAELGDALAYAHERGVIHRDVKPGNVMINPRGAACLVDFGVARLAGITATVTRTGAVTGTLAYLSPEQSAGTRVTAATDVYSLGLVLAEAATGIRIFDGTPAEVTSTRLTRDAPIPELSPVPLAHLLSSMTRMEPGDRPSASLVAATARSIFPDQAAGGAPIAPEDPTVPLVVSPPTEQFEPAAISLADDPGTVGRPAAFASLVASVAGGGRWLRRMVERERETLPDDDRGGRVDSVTSRVLLASAAALAIVLAIGALAAGGGRGDAVDASTEPSTTVAPTTSTTPTTVEVPPPVDDDDEEAEETGPGRGKGKRGGDD